MPTEDEEKTTSEAPGASIASDVTEAAVEAAAGKGHKHHVGAHEVAATPVDAGHISMQDLGASVFTGSKLGDTVVGFGHGHHHVGAASSEEESEIHTEVLREKAARGEAAIKELYEIIESMKEKVAGSEEYWHGFVADSFRERVAVGLKSFETELDALAGYPRELIAYADMHEGVITQANAIASGVEGVEWPEEV